MRVISNRAYCLGQRDSRCRVISWHLCMIDEETVPDNSVSAFYSAVKLPFELAAQEVEESRGQEDGDLSLVSLIAAWLDSHDNACFSLTQSGQQPQSLVEGQKSHYSVPWMQNICSAGRVKEIKWSYSQVLLSMSKKEMFWKMFTLHFSIKHNKSSRSRTNHIHIWTFSNLAHQDECLIIEHDVLSLNMHKYENQRKHF